MVRNGLPASLFSNCTRSFLRSCCTQLVKLWGYLPDIPARMKRDSRRHSLEVTNPQWICSDGGRSRNLRGSTALSCTFPWTLQMSFQFSDCTYHLQPQQLCPSYPTYFSVNVEGVVCLLFHFFCSLIPFLQHNLAMIYCEFLFQTGVCFLALHANSVPESRW